MRETKTQYPQREWNTGLVLVELYLRAQPWTQRVVCGWKAGRSQHRCGVGSSSGSWNALLWSCVWATQLFSCRWARSWRQHDLVSLSLKRGSRSEKQGTRFAPKPLEGGMLCQHLFPGAVATSDDKLGDLTEICSFIFLEAVSAPPKAGGTHACFSQRLGLPAVPGLLGFAAASLSLLLLLHGPCPSGGLGPSFL